MTATANAASAAAARIGSVLSDAQYFESGMVRVEDIRRLLDSRSLKDKLDAMKRVVALISLGRDASIFFPDVVKNVVAPSLDIKKLVYLYLVHYAEDKQDLALLSINSFQKDISDPHELIRALALRVLSSIRVKVILQVVILAIDKCAKDPSPYVRKTAAHAICKVCSLDTPSREILLEPLALLLNDRALGVLGAAVAVLDEVAPSRVDLIHPHFRYLCRSLPLIDPCGQVSVLRVLLRYGRTQFAGSVQQSKGGERDADLEDLLESARPLLQSQHPSVVMSVISMYYHLGSTGELSAYAVGPLMRLVMSSDPGVRYVALRVCLDIAALDPGALLPYISDFFVSAADGGTVRDGKLSVLIRLCENAGMSNGIGSDPQIRKTLLLEFQAYLHRSDKVLAAAATRAMGSLASAHPSSTSAIIGLLANVVATSSSKTVVSASVTVLRRLLQLHPDAQARALPRLVSLLLISKGKSSAIAASEARAAIVWLIGEFYDKVPHVAPEALRVLARNFSLERAETKLQILNLAAKVVAWEKLGCIEPSVEKHPVSADIRRKLLDYVTKCGLLDADYDVRDKARMFRHLFVLDGSVDDFSGKLCTLACSVILHGDKDGRKAKDSTELSRKDVDHNKPYSLPGSRVNKDGFAPVLASLSHVLARRLPESRTLPPWSAASSDAVLREEAPDARRSGGGVMEVASMSSADYARRGGMSLPPSSVASLNTVGNDAVSYNNAFRPPAVRSLRTTPLSLEKFYDTEGDAADDGDSSSSYETASSDEEDEEPLDAPARPSEDGMLIDASETRSPTKAPPLSTSKGLDTSDLLAALYGTSAETKKSPGSSASNVLAHLQVAPKRVWQLVLESWNADGVEVSMSYVSGLYIGGPNATPIALKVSNTTQASMTDIEVVSEGLFIGKAPLSHKIASLAPGMSSEFNTYCTFGGRASPVAFAVKKEGLECGRGEIRPSAGQILRPLHTMTSADFAAKEKSLGGMFGCTKSIVVAETSPVQGSTVSTTEAMLQSARSRVSDAAFLSEIATFAPQQALGRLAGRQLSFAGFLPPSAGADGNAKETVLVSIRFESEMTSAENGGEVSAKLWIGCENVVYANTLANVLKKCLGPAS